MIAAEGQEIRRTVGDTDAIGFRLRTQAKNGTLTDIADDATVALHIQVDPVIELAGVGLGSGRFGFAVAGMSALPAGTYDYEIEVDDGTAVYTHTRGSLILAAQIA